MLKTSEDINTQSLEDVFFDFKSNLLPSTFVSRMLTDIDPYVLNRRVVEINTAICVVICPQDTFAHLGEIPKAKVDSTLNSLVTEDKEEADFEDAVKFFNANRETFVKEYENKFIAIMNDRVVDSDDDFSALAERVYEKYGYRSIYMPKVTKEAEVAHMPTPFLRK